MRTIYIMIFSILIVLAGHVSSKNMKPTYDSKKTQELVETMLDAHGGLTPWREAGSFWFQFMTNVKGSPQPFYTKEHVNLKSDQAYLHWPLWQAKLAWNGSSLKSENWPIKQLPPGFFTKLTASFISLPWLTQDIDVKLSARQPAKLPDSDTIYWVVRMEYGVQRPEIPGTYLDLYIDKKLHLMKGIGFDINHPSMVANPNQAIGPNFHIMRDYEEINGLMIPSYYVSYGKRPDGNFKSNAVHMVFDVRFDKPFEEKELMLGERAVTDQSTLNWWGGK